MPQPRCSPSGPTTVPIAAPAPGVLGRPLTLHTDHVALGQIPRPLGMGCPHLPAAPWNGPQSELDTVPAATQGDIIASTCEIYGAPAVHLVLCRPGLVQCLPDRETSEQPNPHQQVAYKRLSCCFLNEAQPGLPCARPSGHRTQKTSWFISHLSPH